MQNESAKHARHPVCVHFDLQALDNKNGFNTYETEIVRRLYSYNDIDSDSFIIKLRPLQNSNTGFPVRHIKFPGRLISPNIVYSDLKHKVTSSIFRMLYCFLSFNRLTGGKPEDVFVFWENSVPEMPIKGKVIAVLHDIIPLRMKAFYGINADRAGRKAEALISRATKVVTVSEYSKNDIIDYFNADPEKIEVVYNAVDAGKFSREKSSPEYLRHIRSKYGLPEKYILHFGSCLPNKNIPALIQSYAMLPDSIKDEYALVITNPDSSFPPYNNIRELADENGISRHVIFPENIPYEDKAGMYQLASLFAWPSYIEGFGIPILEAQASGVPVISSNASSMPEVGGDSVLYFDPNSPEEMSECMRKCLTDESLSGQLVVKGYENLKRFSWDKSAQKFHDIITSL